MQAMRDAPIERVVSLERQRATKYIAVTAEILGRRMHYDVGTKLKRSLQYRRCESVVASEQAAGFVCNVRERRNVADRHARIRRRLCPDHVDTVPTTTPHRVKIGHVHCFNVHAALRQVLGAERAQAGVTIVGNQDARSVRQRFEHGGDRSHS